MQYLLSEDLVKVILSVVEGSLIGIEREYSSKAAGFRTIALICIGSTLFTILSVYLGGAHNPDRIAANIITGVGFIGAGVIFRDSFSISGITTASCIWATAAIGMSIGSGHYFLAGEGVILVLLILTLFELVQKQIDNFHQKRSYKIVMENIFHEKDIIHFLNELKLKYEKTREMKSNDNFVLYCFRE